MRTMLVWLLILTGLTQTSGILASDELRQIYSDYRKAKSIQKKEAKARQMATILRGARKVDPKFRDEVLAALAKDLKGPLGGVFDVATKIVVAFKNDDGKPAAMCLGVLENPDLSPAWDDYVRALKDWKVDTATIVKSLFVGSAKLRSPDKGLSVIQKEFPKDAVAREAIFKQAADPKGNLGAACFRMLPKLVRKKEDAERVADLFLKRITADSTPEGLRTAQAFMRVLFGDYAFLHFIETVSEDRAASFERLLSQKNPEVRKLACLWFLLSPTPLSSKRSQLLYPVVIELSQKDRAGANLVGALGFLSAVKLGSEETRVASEALEKPRSQTAFGLLSFLLRSGVKQSDLRGPVVLATHADYWRYRGAPATSLQRTSSRLKPAHWTKGDWRVRSMFLRQDGIFSRKALAGQILKDVMGSSDQRLLRYFLEAMWRERDGLDAFSGNQELKEWLQKRCDPEAKGTMPEYAPGLLFAVFGDSAQAEKLIEFRAATFEEETKTPERQRTMYGDWGPMIETIIKLPEKEKYQAFVRNWFAARQERGMGPSPNAAWLTWLFDVRMGKKVGPPPIISLGFAFQPGGTSWLKGLRRTGKGIKEWLPNLRVPLVYMMASTQRAEKTTMAYLGCLDALEARDE